jgi:hypothetical protein
MRGEGAGCREQNSELGGWNSERCWVAGDERSEPPVMSL